MPGLIGSLAPASAGDILDAEINDHDGAGTVGEAIKAGKIASTQRGVMVLGNGDNTDTATISSVATAKTALRYLGAAANASGTTEARDMACKVRLTNATTVTGERERANGVGVDIGWELTEWE